jgi:signal transduction histidine kinase/ActR/RegA family two-component response regulator
MTNRGLEGDIHALSPTELIEHAHALRTVLRVADAVHSATDLSDLGERTVEAMVHFTGYAAVALYRVNEEVASLIAARGFGAETVRAGRTLPLDHSLTGIAVRSGVIKTARELSLDGRLAPATRRALEREGFSDAACVPVFFRDAVIGCLNIVYKRSTLLSQSERAMLASIARSIGIAMQNRIAADDQRELEERLRRSQQLESLGVLAGGIAHDFNNLLTGVIGNVSLAQSAPPCQVPQLLAEAERAAQRASDLARQLSTFARGGSPLKRRTSAISDVVRDAAAFALRGRDTAFAFETKDVLEPALVDPDQLGQVVHNLVLNAAQASPPGALVRVELSRVESPTGPRVRLRVSDQGVGIPQAHLARIFDPYFTTRREGTGLGLAITHSIVTRHRGSIAVRSTPGQGTTFDVEIPYERAAPELPPAPREAARLPARVLLVDDEPQIRTLGRNLLTHLGVMVKEARSSHEAEALFQSAVDAGEPFDGVILDMTLVGSEDGVATLQRLRAIDPGVRAVVSSGYSEADALSTYAEHGFVAALPKPYSLPQMAEALSALRPR